MAKNIRIIPESGSVIFMQNGNTENQSVQFKISGSDPSGSVSITNNNGVEIAKINNYYASNPVLEFVSGGIAIQNATTQSIATPYPGQLIMDPGNGNMYVWFDGMWLYAAGTSGTSGTSGGSGTSGMVITWL